MTTIYLIRHAEAEGNLYRRLHGQYDSMVTINGHKQIEALNRRFADVQLHACYASDLTRTRQTAQGICKSHRLRLRKEPGFREIHCGIWEDESFGTLEYREPAMMCSFSNDMWSWQVPQSETFPQAVERYIETLCRVADSHPNQTIAIFTHGAILRAVQAELFFTRDTVKLSGYCDNTGVSRILYEDGKFTADYLNDNSHLDASISTLARQSWWRNNGGTASRDYNLRYETAADAGALYMDLRGQNWRQRCGIVKWLDESRVEKQLHQILQSAPECLYYGFLGDNLVGALLVEPDNDTDYGVIHYLGILPERQNRGFGVQLLGQAVSHYRRLGKSKMRVLLPAGDYATARFFERHGFVPKKQAPVGRWYEMSIALPK